MDTQEWADNEQETTQPPRKRRRLGRLSFRQERALDELLSKGLISLRWVAQEAAIPESTLRRWLQPGEPFREEYDRRVRLRYQLCEAAVATANDPKASPWTRLQAIDRARELLTPPRSPEEQRQHERLMAMIGEGKAAGG